MGWDANNVTHILGIRAFGTQLLCEQVIGRALRRQSYDLNEGGLFDAEYADIFGVPFDFTAKPVVAPPSPPRETVNKIIPAPAWTDHDVSCRKTSSALAAAGHGFNIGPVTRMTRRERDDLAGNRATVHARAAQPLRADLCPAEAASQ